MLTKDEKKILRNHLFMQLDGLALAATYIEFEKSQYFHYMLKNNTFLLKDIQNIKSGNLGYINIGLRLLTSQGLLYRNNSSKNQYSLTERGKIYLEDIEYFIEISSGFYHLANVNQFIYKTGSSNENNKLIKSISTLIDYKNNYKKLFSTKDKVRNNIYYNLIGIIAGPILVEIGMSSIYNDVIKNNNIDIFLKKINHTPLRQSLEKIFLSLKWTDSSNDITAIGKFYLQRASAYGVTTSYLPLFSKLNSLYFGNPEKILDYKINNNETHVNRKMNVWGSGGAHSLYFSKINLIIIEIFNRPINEQPDGIADMGCGDGSFLIHIYKLILHNTIRGKMILKKPLIIVGADFNQEALETTNINLSSNDIDSILIKADITNPDKFSATLHDDHNINLKNMINVRSFLDHNRIYTKPKKIVKNNCTTGAFSKRGNLIKVNDVVQNLIEHLTMWKPYCQKFGLLILELHTINSNLASNNIGETLASPYDATHGYSDQYIVSLDDFMLAAEQANLIVDKSLMYRFPNNNLPTISINYFVKP